MVTITEELWISVKDNLPELGEKVLLFHGKMRAETKQERMTTGVLGSELGADLGYYPVWKEISNRMPIAGYTHWKMLPATPDTPAD